MNRTAVTLRPRMGRWSLPWVIVAALIAGCSGSTEVVSNTGPTGNAQPAQLMQACEPCHQRQYDETLQSVKSGYRSVSPLFNSLEIASNFGLQGLLESGAIRNNLRPVYRTPSAPGLPSGESMISSANGYQSANDARASFCIGCHDGIDIITGEDPTKRLLPEWGGHFGLPDAKGFRPIMNARPLRDFNFIDATTFKAVLPAALGGPPPAGSRPSLPSQGVACDHCHNAQGPDLARTLQHDGFANMGHFLDLTRIKVGPFENPLVVGPLKTDDPLLQDAEGHANFHAVSANPERIDYLRSPDFCNACHDVRVPVPNIVVPEGDSHNPAVQYFRLENLGTEWATQSYAFPGMNPFNQVVRCQDCHMSLYPFAGDRSYSVHDEESGHDFDVTSPQPAVFPVDKAASGTDPTGLGLSVSQLPDRQVVTHYFTGVDVPLVYTDCATAAAPPYNRKDECVGEFRERVGADRVDIFKPGLDEHGVPLSLQTRRVELLKAATRTFLDLTDGTAQLGRTFHARVTAVAISGHNFPSGFSQERTGWIELTVSAKLSADTANICNDTEFVHAPGACLNDRSKTCLSNADCPGDVCAGICADGLRTCMSDADCPGEDNPCHQGRSQFCTANGEFILYQSGYLVDKPHPETGEMAPDGNLNDEDQEHLHAIVNPFTFDNEIFEEGPDDGPAARIFEGDPVGLVLLRNELLRLYGPACLPAVPSVNDSSQCPEGTRPTFIPASNRIQPRTGENLNETGHVLEEETFAAGLSNTVDNWRSLPPLDPKTFLYEIQLPSSQDLADVGVKLEGPLHVRAAMQFQHFPALFLRFMARVTGAVPYEVPPYQMPGSVIPVQAEQPLNGHENSIGRRGPADYNYRLMDEKRLDDLMKNIPDISTAERFIPLTQGGTASAAGGQQ